MKKLNSRQLVAGFTLIEMLVVVAMVGILSAIAAPSWFALASRQRLNAAQDEALRAMREAQSTARREKQTWEVSFRTSSSRVQWSVHSANLPVADWPWNDLTGEDANLISIDTGSTLSQQNGAYRVQFQFTGAVNGPLGKITFAPYNGGNTQRCVIVSTLLGAVRTAQDTKCQ